GTQHEVARALHGRCARFVDLDMIDFAAIAAANSLRVEPCPDRARERRQALDVLRHDRDARRFDEEEPVAAPCDIAGHHTMRGYFDGHVRRVTETGHVGNRHAVPVVQLDGHHADRRLEAMHAGPDATEMRERHREPDRAMPAHADHADVVEEDDARGARPVDGLAQQRTDDHIGATRLVDDARAETIEIAAEALAAGGKIVVSEIGAAFDDGARGFAGGVRIDDANGLHAATLSAVARPTRPGKPSRRPVPSAAWQDRGFMAAYLLSGGRFLDPRAPELRDGVEVLVEGDRIREVSDRPIASQAATRIDLRGRTLMPGLIDAHVHFFLTEVNLGLLDGMPLTLLTTKAAAAARRMLMRGFTTVRDAGGSDYGMRTAIEE